MDDLDDSINNDTLDINITYPGILIRKGMGLLLVFFVCFLSALSVIPYPNKIDIPFTINPVLKSFTYDIKGSGYELNTILKNINQPILKNEKIARLVNATNSHILEIKAPFDGVFFYTKDAKNGLKLYVFDVTVKPEIITVSTDDAQINNIKKDQVIDLKFGNNSRSLRGFVTPLNSTSLGNKYHVSIKLLPLDRDVLNEEINQNIFQPLSGKLEFQTNKVSFLNKALGMLSQNLNTLSH